VSNTAQQPMNNVVRTALEALTAVLGGTQSLHTNALDEVLALPTEHAARLALRTQQVVAHETGVTNVADPLGGSWFVEWMTDELERQAEAIFAHVLEAGNGSMLDGTIDLIEDHWFMQEIGDAAYVFERKVNSGRRVIVGVNRFTEGDDEVPPLLSIGAEVEELQLKRLASVKQARDDAAVRDALARLATDARSPEVNLMPGIIDAVKVYATEGEIINALADEFGRWDERATI
jgi:methylmalonyl-CoA mutase N-terminal domain/subunit